jgi:hypothetical protein
MYITKKKNKGVNRSCWGVWQAAVKQIGERGIVMVASAGNEGVDTDTTDHFPSTLPDDIIITVAASNRSQGLW